MKTGTAKRLNFRLHDFARVSWVSDTAQGLWTSRLQRISHAWKVIERLTVPTGIRPCALITVARAERKELRTWCKQFDLSTSVVGSPIAIPGSYAATAQVARPGQTAVQRVAVGTGRDVALFVSAWRARDEDTIGALLGYPACCRRFFKKTWSDERWLDTTWPMACNSRNSSAQIDDENASVEVSGPPEANILLRWMGLRAVPHLPCSFHCAETAKFGRAILQTGTEAGFTEEVAWLRDALNWPVQWTAAHGIAEIKTPISKISATTDATSNKLTVRREGSSYPQFGASGIGFPYRNAKRRLASHNGTPDTERPDWYFIDNGFSSLAAMREAHSALISLAVTAIPPAGGTVMDLGCGNGALLLSLRQRNPNIVPFGLERDRGNIGHAKTLLPAFRDNLFESDIFAVKSWPDRQFDLVFFMLGRLIETDRRVAAEIREKLSKCAKRLVVYAYPDWLHQYRDLRALAAKTGISLIGRRRSTSASFARIAG